MGGLAKEMNAVNYLSPRSWLATSNLLLGFFFFLGLSVTSSLGPLSFLSYRMFTWLGMEGLVQLQQDLNPEPSF